MCPPAWTSSLLTSGDGAEHLIAVEGGTGRSPARTAVFDAEGVRVFLRLDLLAVVDGHLAAVGHAVHHRVVPVAVFGTGTLARTRVKPFPVGALLVDALTLTRVVVHAPVPGTRVRLGTETLAQDFVQLEWIVALL